MRKIGSFKRPKKRPSPITLVALVLGAAPAFAGIADSPVPKLQGQTAAIYYSATGVMNGGFGALGTFFSCTSTSTLPMQVSVELFDRAGGAPLNDASATSLPVAPGATVLFGTVRAIGITVDGDLGAPIMTNGSARIVSTSPKLICTAFVSDTSRTPPASGWTLTVVFKTKQKGQ